MRCPRCEQEGPVEKRDTSWFCRICSIAFTESTQVVPPIERGSVWVERGTGDLVTVMEVEGDPFDPYTTVHYTDDENRNVMTAQDFRFYFRRQSKQFSQRATLICNAHEEWEAESGQVYLILGVNHADCSVHVVPVEGSWRSFWIRGSDFVRKFRRFHRPTDFARLLADDVV